MKLIIKNLSLVYPLISLDNYLLRLKIVNKFKSIFKKKKLDNIDNLNKNLTALKNINFEANKGDRIGLVGFNGSGKTSLLKCLAGIYELNSGEIVKNAKFCPILEPYFMCEPNDTVYNNIILIGVIFGLNKKKIIEKIDDILKFSELEEYKYNALYTLSTGMKFRLVFSIFFVAEKEKIYFIDEFLTTGDEKFQNRGMNFINSTDNNIIILCSHSRRLIEKFCNKLLILDKGKQVYFGKVSDGINKYQDLIKN